MPEDSSVYKSIFLHATYAVIISNAEHYIVECNVAALEMFGFEEHEFLGKHKTDIIIIDNELGYEFEDNSFSNKKKPIRAVAFRKNGEQFPISFSSFSFENNLCCFINDISEELAKEKQQERTIEILQETNHIARVGGYEVDIESGKAIWTLETKEIHELPADYEPNLAEAILFYKDGEVRDTIIKVVRDAIEFGIPYSVELPLTTAKGNERWIKATGNTEFKDGKCVRLYGIVQDIHDAKTLQNDLKREKALLRTLIDNLPVAVFVKDEHARKLIANKMDVANMELETEAQALGKTNLEIFDWNESHWGYEQDLKVFSSKKPLINDVQTAINKKGEKIIYSITKTPTFDEEGNLTGLVGVCANITEQVKLEEKLRLVDFAFANAAISIFLLNEDATFYDFNDTAHNLLGYTKEELMALKVEDINPEYNAKEWPNHWAELREKKSMIFTSVERKKDGTHIDVEIKANMIKYGDIEINCAFVTDITEKKKAEAELAKSNERFVHALKATSDVIWDVDLKTNSLFLSDAFETCFGHRVDNNADSNNNVWLNNVHPDDLDGVIAESEKAIKNNKEVWEHEYRLRKADGTFAYVIDKGFVVRAADGQAIRLAGAIRDITQQKEVEITLQRSNERYEYATLATSDMIWESDLVTNEVFFSKNFELIFGYKTHYVQNLENNVWRRNIHPDDYDSMVALRSKMLQGNEDKWDDEYRFRKANGEYAWVLDKTLIIRDENGTPVRLVGAVRDITLQKKAEITLQRSNERYEYATLATSDMIWESDLVTNEVFFSKNIELLFGYSTEEKQTTDSNIWRRNIHPEDIEKIKQKRILMLKTHEDKWDDEYRFKKANGVYAWILDKTLIIRNGDGKPIKLVGAIRDITNRKEAEIILQNSNKRYEYATMATSDAIWEADLENNLLFLSDNYSLIFGHKSGVFSNNSNNEWLENVHPEDLPDVLSLVENIIESKQNKWENEYRLLNGQGIYSVVLNRGFVVRDENGKAIKLVGAMRDITTKRVEEERLKLLETVIINSTDAILITGTEPIDDVDLPIIYVNKAFTDITGYKIRDLIGKTPRILQGPLTDKNELDKMSNAIKNWVSCEIEIINYKKDGTPFWSNISIVPVANEKGWYTHWVSIQKDVTIRKETERAFAEMAALQRSILDSANLAIISTDINGIIKSYNEGAESMLGYKAHEIIDKVTPEFVHDKEEIIKRAHELTIELGRQINPGFDVFIAKAKLGISTETEWTYIHKNKSRFPVSLSITSLHDAEGKVIGYLGIAKDITYEREIKEELRISYEKLEETVNELKQQQFAIDQHDIVSITDVKGTIIYANESFCKISKYTKEELIGQNHRIVKSGAHNPLVFKEMYHAIANGEVWKGDLCNKAKDGTIYWVSNTIVPYMDAKTNKPLRYVSIRTDITDKKLAELEREKLLEEVTNNNRELKQFSYITSHNLRAPLTNLLSICNLIKSDSIADPLTKKLIEGFKKSTFDLNDTLNDLISILIIKENINLPTAEVDFEQTLQKVVSSINKSVEKTKTIINTDFSEVPSVHFNPTYLESIFLNLITNSIKYAKPGIEPTINITTTRNEEGSIKMVFTDNGIGMDMERVKNKIFGLYQRFHSNADSKGIGLYLIQSQVNALGGKIDFYSKVNIGTTFTLTFK